MTFIRLYTTVVTAGGIVGCLYFIVRYWIRTSGRWIRSEAGRFMMFTYMNLCALLILVLLGPMLGPSLIRTIISELFYTMLGVFAWWPARLLNKAGGMMEDKGD